MNKKKVTKMIEIKDTSIQIIRNFTYGFKHTEGIRRIKTNLSEVFLNVRKGRNSFSLDRVCCDLTQYTANWEVNTQNSVFHDRITHANTHKF